MDMVAKSDWKAFFTAYNEGFGLAILVYPTEVLQKNRAPE